MVLDTVLFQRIVGIFAGVVEKNRSDGALGRSFRDRKAGPNGSLHQNHFAGHVTQRLIVGCQALTGIHQIGLEHLAVF